MGKASILYLQSLIPLSPNLSQLWGVFCPFFRELGWTRISRAPSPGLLMKDAQGLGEPHPFMLICLRKLQSEDCSLGTQDSEPVPAVF